MRRRARRKFLIAAGGLIAAPLARAQAPDAGRSRRIGFLALGFESKVPRAQRPTMKMFKKLGWVDGENLQIERAYAELKAEHLAPLAQALVRKRVEVIWTIGPEATLAAARATRSIPLVFFNVPFPVEQGFVDSFARPGRNVTGTSFFTGVGVLHKLIEMLREVAPDAKRLSRLAQPDSVEVLAGGRIDVARTFSETAQRLGFESRTHEIRELADVDAAFTEITAWSADAMFTAGGDHLFAAGQRIAEFALRRRLPSAFLGGLASKAIEAGGLLSYGPAPSEAQAMLIRCVEYIDRILRGARPGDLPVQQPANYELVINAKTAKALDLRIPQTLLVRADRVIE
jgi:putative ABC transport system substrate-binding protein